MPVTRSSISLASALAMAISPAIARGEDASVTASSAEGKPAPLELRLTLSSFLFRQTGDDAAPFVASGAPVVNASPVRRHFGDLRVEPEDRGVEVDAPGPQTTSERYQAGATAGSEYEVRTLAFKLGSSATSLTLGRQYIDAVGASKVDGLSLSQRITQAVTGTIFAGAFPDLGSRSVTTDYTEGLVPLSSGLGVAYQTPDYHGDIGAAGVYAKDEADRDASRVFVTSSGYWRPQSAVDIYHFALADVAGAAGAALRNGSLGIDVHPTTALKLSLSGHHVSTDLLEVRARDALADPDPAMLGVVQNDLAITRVSSDLVRTGTSVTLARSRFELSAFGSLHRRPAIDVPVDGGMAVVFPEARTASLTMSVLDRRSVGGLRASLAATLTWPLVEDAPARSRGTVVRAVVGTTFAEARGQVEADLTAERMRDIGSMACASSIEPLACFGTATITAAQAGTLASWRIAREWLVLADAHLGYQNVESRSPSGTVQWPNVYSVTVFTRVQWRYR